MAVRLNPGAPWPKTYVKKRTLKCWKEITDQWPVIFVKMKKIEKRRISHDSNCHKPGGSSTDN